MCKKMEVFAEKNGSITIGAEGCGWFVLSQRDALMVSYNIINAILSVDNVDQK